MKKGAIILLLFSVLCTQGHASCKCILRLISSKGETTDIYRGDILTIDTLRNILVLTSHISEKLGKQDFRNGSALLNDNGKFVRVSLHEVLSSTYEGDPSIDMLKGNLFFYDNEKLVLNGEVWKVIAIREKLPISNSM